jgi:hypothetical protein
MFPDLFTWSSNVLLAGYTDSQNSSGDISASATATGYSGLTNTYVPSASTYNARLASMQYWNSNSNFRLGVSSPYLVSATDNTNVGVNMDTLEDAQGLVKNVRALSITSSGFTAAFHAPDPSTSCYVGYGTGTDPTAWRRTSPNISASQERSITVSGLTTKTVYNWQVWCVNTAPAATQTVLTQ